MPSGRSGVEEAAGTGPVTGTLDDAEAATAAGSATACRPRPGTACGAGSDDPGYTPAESPGLVEETTARTASGSAGLTVGVVAGLRRIGPA